MAAPKISGPQLEAFREGARLFNSGRFFEAHEAWEKDWRRIPDPDRAQTQAAILVCGVFVLVGKGRFDAARRLAELALERFAEAAAQSRLLGTRPALELAEAEDRLLRVLASLRTGLGDASALARHSEGIRVNVLAKGED
jgi:predicted metal-dependent hydrolase